MALLAQKQAGLLPSKQSGLIPSKQIVSLWTPLNLGSALVAWWDPSQGLTMNGAGVASWTDRVGNRAASQGAASAQPTTTTVNGKPRLAFGGSQRLSFSAATLPFGTAPTTLLVSAASVTLTDTTFRSPFGYVSGTHAGRLFYSSPNLTFANSGGPDNATSVSWSGKDFLAEAAIDAASNVTILIDGTQVLSTALSQQANNGDTAGGIGYWPAYGSNWSGTVGHCVVVTSLTVSQRQKYEGWESWSTGKAGANLPAGHPYKSRSPYVSDP